MTKSNEAKTYNVTILVDGGETFDGNLGHWSDRFFSFPDNFTLQDKLAEVIGFCMSEGWEVTIRLKKNND